jgi:hypothetical protein
MEVSIFFDFRTVYGEADLTHELRRAIQTGLRDQAAFFHHFAQNALTFKPPFRLLGNIYLGGGRDRACRRNQPERCDDADGQFCAPVCPAPPN